MTLNDPGRRRPLVAFFDFPDVFEDFYPHYGVSQRAFATSWAGSGNHAFVRLIQREIADVVWYVLSLAPELDEARHEVTGCRVRFLQGSPAHRVLWRAFWLPRFAWRWYRFYPAFATPASYLAPLSWGLIRELRATRPDCLFAQDYSSGRFDVLWLLARALGARLVAYHSGSPPGSYLGRRLRRRTLPRADHLIASGRGEVEHLRSRFGVPAERISVVLTPVDTDVYRPVDRAAACATAGLDPARRYLLFVGRLDDRIKRVSHLLRAFAALVEHHPDVDLLIAGTGPDLEALQQLAQAITPPGRVRLLGWVGSAQQKAALYSLADCLVLPSAREGFPTVVAEAMLCATPVIATRVGAVEELVDDETGWPVAADDDSALAAALSEVARRPEIIAARRQPARRRARARVGPEVVAGALRPLLLGERAT
jgi:glycosyltransferase involved in cell wall biosynthesis